MLRSPKRLLRRKLLDRRIRGPRCSPVQASGACSHSVLARCLSDEPLLSPQGRYLERFPPLSRPLAGLRLPPHMLGNVEQYPTKITTLPNGLRIASEDSVGPAACIGLYVDCGSIYEKESSTGITHILERLAYKSTRNRSHLRLLQEIEATGGTTTVSASREQMGYTYDTLKTYAPQAIEILIDSVRNPMFLDQEVKEQVVKLKAEIQEISKDPQQFLLESLHLVGYSGALGRPLIAPDTVLDRLDGFSIGNFLYDNYTSDRMVLAANGLDHDQLLAIAEPILSDMQRGLPLTSPKSIYVGGEIRHKENSEQTHVALAFEVPGGWRREKHAAAVTVLQFLLGGGGSFSTGGPGKGMHSRLYLRVLKRYQQVHSIVAFSTIYNDSGLFGIQLTTGSDFVAKLVVTAVAELLAVATPGQVTEVEFQRAKNVTKSAILMNLESRMIVTEDIGRQILTYGCRKPVEHFLGILDELTLDDLTTTARRLLSSKLTMACLGDADRIPNYECIRRKFQLSGSR